MGLYKKEHYSHSISRFIVMILLTLIVMMSGGYRVSAGSTEHIEQQTIRETVELTEEETGIIEQDQNTGGNKTGVKKIIAIVVCILIACICLIVLVVVLKKLKSLSEPGSHSPKKPDSKKPNQKKPNPKKPDPKRPNQEPPAPKPPKPDVSNQLNPTVPVIPSDIFVFVKSGYMAGQAYPIEASKIRIGREKDCWIRYPDDYAGISGHHAIIWKENGRIYLKDDNSSYGTYVETSSGVRKLNPHQPVELRVGSVFYLADNKNRMEIVKAD